MRLQRGWQSAADLGPNGIAPWFHRPGIADTAKWIWTADAGQNQAYNSANTGFQNQNINVPGADGGVAQTEAGNCFLRTACDLTQMSQPTAMGTVASPTYEVHMKNEAYQPRPGYNASTDHGSADDSPPIPGLSVGDCEAACTADNTCECIVYQTGVQPEGHDNIFCRFTQPNQEINCYGKPTCNPPLIMMVGL